MKQQLDSGTGAPTCKGLKLEQLNDANFNYFLHKYRVSQNNF